MASLVGAVVLLVTAEASAAALCEALPQDRQVRATPAQPGQKPGHDQRQDGGRRRKWWQDEKDRAELGLSVQQSAAIEQIFQDTIPRLRAMNEELQQLERTLTETIAAGTADAATVQRQADKLENTRAKLSSTRTVMLYRMHQVLSAEQRTKLKAMFDREADRRAQDRRDDKRDEPKRH